MTVEIRRGSSRFLDRSGRGEPAWSTSHSFSFGAHYDAERISFGPMVCHDDHLLARGSGFPVHHHAGLSIVTWVLSGAVGHTDDTTHDSSHADDAAVEQVVRPGEVAVLHAGSGVDHAEVAVDRMTRFVQVWLTPPDADLTVTPTYTVTAVDPTPGCLVQVAAPQPGATLSVARLGARQSVLLPAAALVHVFVGRGALLRSSLAEPLADGDAFLFTDEPAHEVTAGADTELLVWAFDEPATR